MPFGKTRTLSALVAELQQKIKNLVIAGFRARAEISDCLIQLADKDRAIGLASRHLERPQQAIQYLSAKLEDNEESCEPS
jgi:hypothetical protein